MKKDYVELVFIVDRSGSMSFIASDMEGAIKSVIQEQKKLDKKVLVTYTRFDTEYEKVFSHKPVEEVDEIKVEPRGCTALLDAIGNTVNSFERDFSESDEKPSKVLFVIITDGGENASKEYSRDKVFGIIETVKRDHDWEFTFIGANQDAIGEGGNLGIQRGNSLNYKATSGGVRAMSQSLMNYTTDYFSGDKATFEENDDKD